VAAAGTPERRVVTISASAGAGGSVIGPRVAEELGLPFVDRAIPAAVASELAVPIDDALAREESSTRLLDRLLARLATSAQIVAGVAVPPEALEGDDRAYLAATEEALRDHAARGAVLLGRAAAVVLRDVSGALHVRLDGPRERRLADAMRRQNLDREAAEAHLRRADHARETYVRHWYGVEPGDPSLYHLVIDTTELGLDAAVDLIVVAAGAAGR
jgi:cytidylate kinase